MKNRKNNSLMLLPCAALALLLAQPSAYAVDVVKTNNLDTLDLASTWVGGAAPGTNDVAVFDSTYATTGTLNAAALVQWSGLRVASPGGNVLVNNSTSPNNIGLGAGGIDMSSAGVDLVIRRYQMDASQTWNVAAGRIFRIGSPGATFAPAANNAANNRVGVFVNNSPGATITKNGAGTVYLDMGNATLGSVNWQINAGTVAAIWNREAAFGTGTITLAGGGLADGTPIAGSLGNWTWNNPIILQSSTSSFIDNQNTGGADRWLKLESPISGSGNLEFRDTGVGFNNVNEGFILAGTNIFTGTLTIATNTEVRVGGANVGVSDDIAGNNGTLGDGAAPVINNGTLTFSRDDAHSVSNTISGTGQVRIGITQTLGGTLPVNQVVTFDGVNTYSGNTTINMGTLALGSGGSIANTANIFITPAPATTATFDVSAVPGGFTLNSGQKLVGSLTGISQTVNGNVTASGGSVIVPGGSNSVNTLTFNNNLSLGGGGSLLMDVVDNVSYDIINVSGNLNCTGVTTIQAVNLGGLTTGDYPLIQVSGTLNGSETNFNLTGLISAGTRQSFSIATDTNVFPAVVKLVVAGSPPASLTWVGDGTTNLWNVDGALNWDNFGSPDKFFQNDAVNFYDGGSTNPAVNLVGNLSPSSVTVSAGANYTFSGSGSITGAVTTLTHNGPGTLTLGNTNTYGGLTTVNGGTLAVTGGAALADSGSVSVAGGTFQANASETVSTVTSVAGATVNVQGGATLTVTNANLDGTLSGAGTLMINQVASQGLDGNLTTADALALTGTLVLRGGKAAASPGSFGNTFVDFWWLHATNGSQLAGTKFALDTGASPSNALDLIIGDWDATSGNRRLTLSTLTGHGSLRSDAGGDGTRHIIVDQATDTTFNGMILSHVSADATNRLRNVLLEKQGVGTLTMANVVGRQTASAGTSNSSSSILVGGGKLVLLATNTLTGTVTVNSGATLEVTGAGLLGTGISYANAITNNGTLTFDTSADQVLVGDIAGTGVLNKTNGNTLTLAGTNTYSGATTVSQGTLAISSAHNGGGNLTAADGTALIANNNYDGSSALLSAVSLGSGGTVAVTFPNVTSTTVPIVNATNGLTVNGITVTIGDDSTNSLAAGSSYPLIAYGTSFTGSLPSPVLPAGYTGSLTNDTVNKWIALNVATAPVLINPNPGNIDFSAVGGSLTLTWTTNAGWILQTLSTNRAVGLTTNWVDVPGSGSVTTTNFPTTGEVQFFRLRHP